MELPFEPMLLTPAAKPFADDGWIYQVKWDGIYRHIGGPLPGFRPVVQ